MRIPWKSPWLLALVVLVLVGLSIPWVSNRGTGGFLDAETWLRLANPGPLHRAHASLEADCSRCHSPVDGATDEKCVQCHANEETLLLLQPTAFHRDIGSCRVCHREHRGREAPLSEMDHERLASVVAAKLLERRDAGDSEILGRIRRLSSWAGSSGPSLSLPDAGVLETALDCNQCHSRKDPHAGYFGTSCAACHSTDRWTIASYRHPSDRSTDCRQCHRPPLSHSSPMFAEMCASMLGKKGIRVASCHACHRITSWFEIRGAPWHRKSMGHGFGR